jgi:hypothetical protein
MTGRVSLHRLSVLITKEYYHWHTLAYSPRRLPTDPQTSRLSILVAVLFSYFNLIIIP